MPEKSSYLKLSFKDNFIGWVTTSYITAVAKNSFFRKYLSLMLLFIIIFCMVCMNKLSSMKITDLMISKKNIQKLYKYLQFWKRV